MILLALLWTSWCVLHSLLITGRVNRWIRQRGGILQGTHRLLYILFSLLSLMPVLWYQYSLPQRCIFSFAGPWRILQAALLLYAAIMFYGGQLVYDSAYFLGLSQWKSFRDNRPLPAKQFSCSGILRYVRHPWYSGGIAFLWGLSPVTDVTLTARVILTAYLLIGTVLEEAKLAGEFGAAYRDYCRRVPMLIPWRGRVKI